MGRKKALMRKYINGFVREFLKFEEASRFDAYIYVKPISSGEIMYVHIQKKRCLEVAANIYYYR